METDPTRRRILAVTCGLLAALPLGAEEKDEEEGVTAPEDLMKEHGVLNRCLLIYEEGIRRIDDVAPEVFSGTADLIRAQRGDLYLPRLSESGGR